MDPTESTESTAPNGSADSGGAPPASAEKLRDPSIEGSTPPPKYHPRRRVASEDYELGSAGMPVVVGFPPPQVNYNLSSSAGASFAAEPNPFLRQPPSTINQSGRGTISDMYSQTPSYQMGSPAGLYPAAGSPYASRRPRGMSHDAGPFFGSSDAAEVEDSRRKRKVAGHRRVRSDGYGAFLDSASAGPPGRSQAFSPRSELLKLTDSFRSSRTPTGSTRTNSPSPSMLMAPPAPFGDPAMGFPRDNGPVYGAGNGFEAFIGTPRTGRHMRTDSGGEAVFMMQSGGSNTNSMHSNKGKHHRKTTSSRKMHMRQRSAQLFMEDIKGVHQTPSCRNISFLLLFVFHLIGIVYLGQTFGYESLRYYDEAEAPTVTIIYQNLIYVSLLSGAFAIVLSSLALLMMMALAKHFVKIALILTSALSFVWGTVGIGLSPKKIVPATGVIALMLTVAYTVIVWDRCKFHGANLYASLTGVSQNPLSILIAFFSQFLALGWSIYYVYVAVGVYDAVQEGDIEISSKGIKTAIYVSLGVSYYWTLQVFLNIVQVTVASIIGHWWYVADGTKSGATVVFQAFFHACFYSIGSICFGSLVVGPVKVLRQLSALFRPSSETSSLLCFHQCIDFLQNCLTSCVDGLARRFNPWAFTYVGLYGYELMEAGLHSTELFEKRGWTKIVSDDLVPNVLLLTSLVIGGVTGLFAHLIENFDSLALTSLKEPILTSFFVGVVVGLVVSSVLFGIISSSVNAVIVCFAATPVDFDNNHPTLSAEMRNAWREVWPGCMDVVDMRMAVAYYDTVGGEQQPLLHPL